MKEHILMADIIGSSGKDSRKLMNAFRETVQEVNKRYNKQMRSPLTITLGDEFQGVVDSLGSGVEIIFAVDELLLQEKNPYSLRYALVYGKIDTPLNREIAHGMLGEGLTRARKLLETMKKGDREIMVEGLEAKKEEKLLLAFDLYRSLYNDWPAKDRQTAYDFLQEGDYKKVAQIHGKDNSSMWRKEKSLKMREFAKAKKLIKLLLNE